MRRCLLAFLLAPTAAMAAGMPQLDFANPLTLNQLIWGAVIFVVLYVLASRSALPAVASVLEQRASHIARDLQSAQEAKTRSDAAVAEVTAATARARAEAHTAINTALDEAKAAAATQSEALNARLEKQLAEAEAQIAGARDQAMSALRQVATDTATSVITRLTGAAPDQAMLDSAISAALAARQSA